MTVIPIVIGVLGTVTKLLVHRKEGVEVRGPLETKHYNIVEIGQNTKKSPGNLRRLAITQTPVKTHQLTLV